MKFDGTNWVFEGDAGFTTGAAYTTTLAFSPSGEPYVAYRDKGNLYRATVMKYDGSKWVYDGNAGFSVKEVEFITLAFSPDGYPYVAFSDNANGYKATVMCHGYAIGIEEPQNSQVFSYPNPAADKITFETSLTKNNYQLRVMDINGRQCIAQDVVGPKAQIDISNLPSGVYFYKLTFDRTGKVGKIIKL